MIQEFEYRIQEQGAILTGCTKEQPELVLPQQLCGYPVVGIDKKVFLGKNKLVQVILPSSLLTIGDWAFAHCRNLEWIQVPDHSLTTGKEVCVGCRKLRYYGTGRTTRDCLLPMMMKHHLSEQLCNPAEYYSNEWYARIDQRIGDFLDAQDNADYQGLWTFGEEDYTDRNFEIEIYEEERRKDKAELCLCRMLLAEALPHAMRARMEDYLVSHSTADSAQETLHMLMERHGTELEYFQAFVRLPGITGEEICRLLEGLPETSTGIRAFLVNSSKELLQKHDFFDTLLS